MRRSTTWSLSAVLIIAACTSTDPATPPGSPLVPASSAAPPADAGAYDGEAEVLRVVTLGDGYTRGSETDLPGRDSWPAQLVEALKRDGRRVYLRNIAEASSSAYDVLTEQVDQVGPHQPDVVTLQVGVNDILGHETDAYRESVAAIFDRLLRILPPERIFAITTPDHTLTRWGQAMDPAAVSALNETLREVATERGIVVIDIGAVNELVADDPSLLIQQDPPKPLPTAKQYAGWAEIIGLYIHAALVRGEP